MIGEAQLQGCALLLAEELQDGGVYDGVTVRSPFTPALGEAIAAYTVAPVATRRHPARGRPKKK